MCTNNDKVHDVPATGIKSPGGEAFHIIINNRGFENSHFIAVKRRRDGKALSKSFLTSIQGIVLIQNMFLSLEMTPSDH